MTDYATELIELSSGLSVPATVRSDLPPQAVLAVEVVWGPLRIEAVLKMIREGVRWEDVPEHAHWNWSNKLRGFSPLVHKFMAVECRDETQGLMRLDLASEVSRMTADRGKPTVYVDFLESAPWNARQFTNQPQFKLSGFRLVEAAVRCSAEEGFHGRIGLHALPQASGFYEGSCGMKSFGADSEHEGLTYYELSRDLAAYYLRGEPWQK